MNNDTASKHGKTKHRRSKEKKSRNMTKRCTEQARKNITEDFDLEPAQRIKLMDFNSPLEMEIRDETL